MAVEVIRENVIGELKQGFLNSGWDAVQRTGPKVLTEAAKRFWLQNGRDLQEDAVKEQCTIVQNVALDVHGRFHHHWTRHHFYGSWKTRGRFQEAQRLFPERRLRWLRGEMLNMYD
jgi:hypothetical protein